MIDKINRMGPESPDAIIASSPQSNAALPRFAHLNRVIDKVTEVVDIVNTTLPANGTIQFPVLAADPVTDLQDGQAYYNSTTDVVRLRSNGAWINL